MPDPAPVIDPKPPAVGADGKPVDGGAKPFDPSTLGDGDIAKVLEDPRLWKHPRMIELTDAQKALNKAKEDRKAADEAALVKNKEFEKLAATRADDLTKARTDLQTERINNRIITAATSKGVVDVDAALKLIDRSKIVVKDDGAIEGITEAIDALTKDKPYLIGGKKGGVGHGTNPAEPGTGTRFKLSEIRNPMFYQAHQKEILQAQVEGRIDDDTK